MRFRDFFSACILAACLPLVGSADDLVIAGYGDSLTGDQIIKWCGHVQAPDSCDWTHALPGERTEAGSARLIADLDAGIVAPETTHVTLAWGANDIRKGGFDWETGFAQPLRDAAAAVRAAGFEPVLVVTLDQYQVSPGQSETECDPYPFLEDRLDVELSPRVYAVASEFDPPIPVVDLNTAYDALPESTRCPGAWELGYYKDHVHQTSAGYQFMADTMVAGMGAEGSPSVPMTGMRTRVVVLAGLGLIGALGLALRKNRVA